ncbi:unnamed protein product [Adineta ricciae]|uniref:Chitin-binding type-1 domain-containing protein n=1 Tax=Adineta ricciae TaxID=249248 RepID=A0A815MTF7_ADIRI|nr:unnamed protein product [Adineta ricciae]
MHYSLYLVFIALIGSLYAQNAEQNQLTGDESSGLARLPSILSRRARGASCPHGMCLSKWGYCGTTDAYCGRECQGGPCRGGSEHHGGYSGGRSGDATYFHPGLGACGGYNHGNEFVVAMAAPDFDPHTPNGNPNNNRLCGRHISVNGPRGSVTVRVVDRCPACRPGDLDLSPAAFDRIADRNQGRCQLKEEQQAQQKYNDPLGVQHEAYQFEKDEESQDSFVIDDGALPPDKPCSITISYVTELELVKNRTKIRFVVPTTLCITLQYKQRSRALAKDFANTIDGCDVCIPPNTKVAIDILEHLRKALGPCFTVIPNGMSGQLAPKALISELEHLKLSSSVEKDSTEEIIKKNIVDISLKHSILSL